MQRLNSAHRRESIVAYILLLPCLLGFLTFILFPLIGSLLISFTEWDFLKGFAGIKWVGFDNYKYLLSGQDEWFSKSAVNTIVFAAVTVPLGIILGMATAVLIHRYVYLPTVFKVVVFIPYISSIIASSVVWMVVFQPSYGPVNNILTALGVENLPGWFTDIKWAFPTIMAFQIWQTLGYNVVVFLAGLKGIPNELYEAATIDGASEWQKFRFVTIPMISPTTFFLSTMGFVASFKVFDSVKVLTGGGPGNVTTVIAFYIYREAFKFYRMGTADAAAWLMFILIFAVTLIQMRKQKDWVVYD